MKNILDKINKADEIQANKVELGKHEVELGSVQELKKALDKIPVYIKEIENLRGQFKKQVFDIESKALDMGSIYSTVKDNAMKLGIDPESIPEVKNYQSIKKTLTDAVNKAVFGK